MSRDKKERDARPCVCTGAARPRACKSIQARVREAIKAHGEISIKGMQEALGIPGPKGYSRITVAARDLMRRECIKRTSPGTYAYVGEPKGLDYSRAQRRMIRVIRIRTKRSAPFTARQLAELAECSHDWTKRYLTFLKKEGYVAAVGAVRVGPSRVKTPVYLAVPEKLNEEWPAMRRNKKTSDIDAIASKIRETAYKVARECDADAGSLKKAMGDLREMVEILESFTHAV